MKNVFLSAVMMMAFCGVSNAKDVAEMEAVQSGEKLNNFFLANSLPGTCPGVWGAAWLYSKNHGASDAQADCIAWAAFIKCLGFKNLENANAQLDMGPGC